MTAKHKRSSRKVTSAKKTVPKGKPLGQKPSTDKDSQARKAVTKRKRLWRRGVSLGNRRVAITGLLLVAAFAFLVRCLHLFESGRHYIMSADSHVFHWMAERIMDGLPIPDDVIPSGIAYPLAYIAKAMGFVFRLSDTDALTFVGKFLPPFLSVITAVAIYLVVRKMYDRRTGLLSALAWAALPHAYFIQGAGYLDRDVLNVPLIMIGAFVFYLCKGWHVRIKGLDVGWVVGAFLVLAIELVLYLEWSWVGPALLLAIIVAYFAAEFLVKLLQYEDPSVAARYQSSSQQLWARIRGTARESKWQPFVVIVGLNVLAALANLGTTSAALDLLRALLSPGGEIAEVQGLAVGDLILFQFFLLLIPIGLFLAAMRHREGDILILSWFLILFILSLFSRRTILYATPAAAVLAGTVLASLFDMEHSHGFGRKVQKVVAVLAIALLVGLSSLALSVGSEQRVSANNDWRNSLEYIRTNTPEDAVVMSWWDYGYWILDIADRTPVVDGGLYGHTIKRDDDVGLVYCATNASEAIEIMQQYGADYIVFSTVEDEIWRTISSHGGITGTTWTEIRAEWLINTLWARSLFGGFQSEDGLERVYPPPEVQNPNIVVLGIAQE